MSDTKSHSITGKKMVKVKMSKDNNQIAKTLAKLFSSLIESDKKVEVRREVLAEINEFEPFALYNTIIKGGKIRSEVMTSECLRSFLRDNHVQSINSILPQEFGRFLSSQIRALNPN